MIYARTQLDEVIDAAERRRWRHDDNPEGWGAMLDFTYRGYSVLKHIGTEVYQTLELVKLRAGKPGMTSWASERIALSPWLVEELREMVDREHLGKCMDDALDVTRKLAREMAEKEVEPTGWHRDEDGDWLYESESGRTAGVGQMRIGQWRVSMCVPEPVVFDTEQQALDWASAKLGVKAPRADFPPCHWTRVPWSEGEVRSICLNCGCVRELERAEKPAAGPWKAWPENTPEGGHVYLVKGKRQDESTILTCACWIVVGTEYGPSAGWRSTISSSKLRQITHFAELRERP